MAGDSARLPMPTRAVGDTDVMRVYLPATAADLGAETITARRAHAVTSALRQALPEEDQEGWETSATLCAADSSVWELARQPVSVADCRIVIAADVDDAAVRVLQPQADILPGSVEVVQDVRWTQVAALLVDAPQTQPDVRAARAGDEDAFERAAQADLLWFDVTERKFLAAQLAARS